MKTSSACKIIAFLLAALCLFGAAGMLFVQGTNPYAIWGDQYFSDYDLFARQLILRDAEEVSELVRYYRNRQTGVELSSYAQHRMAQLEEAYAAANTNLRWQAVGEDGTVYWGNCAGERNSPAETWYTMDWALGRPLSEPEGPGYMELVLWVDQDYTLCDDYQQLHSFFTRWRGQRGLLMGVNIALAVLGLALTVYLCVAVCHRKGQAELHRSWFHRLPGDVLLCAMILAGLGLCAVIAEATNVSYMPLELQVTVLALSLLGLVVLAVALLITLAARCKTRTLLKNTLIGRIVLWTARSLCRAINALPLVWKAALLGLCYLLFSAVFLLGLNAVLLWVLVTAALVGYLCWWAYQWKLVRQGTREIIGGNVTAQIETRRMPPDLRDHAGELNNLGQAVGTAVEERLRSERFKAELITNVSHDLKTPLTSIISYVDLLKREDIENQRARDYIEVLDRKSQRLKKLTEDLVEASKASTGAITLERERLDLVQLTEQALGEFDQRLSQRGLAVVRTLPDHPLWVTADGRHLWRVAENLLSNCAKYALEGTRVYVELQECGHCVRLTVKNISREELNIPAQRLTQRFVRGDESRTNEGSGLGLSIAQSLTELQGGQFELEIDGDLFKAIVTLPQAEAEAQG